MKLSISKPLLMTLALTGLIPLTACSKSNKNANAAKTTPSPSEKIAAASTADSRTQGSSGFADVEKRMQGLDTRMDSIFANAFRNVGNWFDNSIVASSVDLREQNGNYVTHVYVPSGNTDKADVKIENGTLHIVMNDERTINGKTEPEHYEQIINFPKPVQSDKMQVQRKKDLIVITVPKQTASTPAVASAPSAAAGSSAWENTMFDKFAQIQNQMNQALRDVFPNNTSIGATTSQLESAVNLDDQKDKYVVHFYLPDRNVSDVSVNYKDGELDLTAKQQHNTTKQTASGTTMQSSASGRYEEMITLPGPVIDKDMIVNRQAGSVTVILPKA